MFVSPKGSFNFDHVHHFHIVLPWVNMFFRCLKSWNPTTHQAVYHQSFPIKIAILGYPPVIKCGNEKSTI
jgi:hypothetical protein